MPQRIDRRFWSAVLLIVVAIGISSRLIQTGIRLFDKYLGDALYAVMVYVLLRLTGRIRNVALWAAIAMLAIELFQLTGIAAGMLSSNSIFIRVLARLLGTEFSFADLLAYAAGIACIAAFDRQQFVRLSNGGSVQ